MLAAPSPADGTHVVRLSFGFVEQPPSFGDSGARVALPDVEGKPLIPAVQREQHPLTMDRQLNWRRNSSNIGHGQASGSRPRLLSIDRTGYVTGPVGFGSIPKHGEWAEIAPEIAPEMAASS